MKTNTTNNKARLQEWSSGHFYPTKLVAFNAFSKRYDEIEPESEIVPGMIIIKMFWSAGAGDYVTVPGASLHRVNADLQLELIND